MAIEDGLFAVLSGNTGVNALVGTDPSRIYPVLAPESPTYPYIVYHDISEVVPNAMGSGTTDIVRRRYQFDCYGETDTDCRTLAAAVIAALDRYQGTSSGVVIQDVYRMGVTDIFDFEARKFKRAVDLEIVYTE